MDNSSLHNEKELLLKMAEGDASVYPYLHDTYYNSLVFFSLSIIQDQQQAEDIAIESITKIWQLHIRFETMGKLRAYLFTLVRNASLNYLKHLKMKGRSQQELFDREMLVDSQLEALVVMSDLMRLIYKEIEQLPATYRSIIESLYLEGLSSAEAADKLGINMENLRQRKGRAIKELRTKLIKKGISDLLFFLSFI